LVFQEKPDSHWYDSLNPKSWLTSDTPAKPGEKSLLDPSTWFSAPEWVGKLGEGLGEFLKAFGTLLGTVNKVAGHAAKFLDWSVDSAKELVELCKDKFHGSLKELPFYEGYKKSFYSVTRPDGTKETVQRGSDAVNNVLYYDVRLASIKYRLHELKVYYAPVVNTVTTLRDLKERMSSGGSQRARLAEEIAAEQRQAKISKRDHVLRKRRLPQDKSDAQFETFSPDGTAKLPMPKWEWAIAPGGTDYEQRFVNGTDKADVKIVEYLKKITPILNRYNKEVSELEEEIYKLGYYKGKVLSDENIDANTKALIDRNNGIITDSLDGWIGKYGESNIQKPKGGKATPLFQLFQYR